MHVRIPPFVLVLLTSFTFAAAAFADPITGRIVDPDGRAVRGATVLLVDGASVVDTAVTDASGAFSVNSPPEGTLTLHVSASGFSSRPVRVASDADVGVIALEVSAVREAVVVSAAQVDIPLSTTSSSVTVLTAEDIEKLQLPTVTDALRLVAGMAVATAGGMGAQTSVFPRGGESDYSLVFIDGVQANAFGGGFDFAHVPIANVERIEIVRGPQSALYGSNAIGSVIRLVTRRGGPPAGSALMEAGGHGTSRIAGAGSGSIDSWQWGGSLDRLSSDGVVENDDYERWSVAGGAGWARGTGIGVRADVHYMNDDRGFPGPFGADPGGTFGGIDTVSRGDNDRWLASISGKLAAGARAQVHGQLTHSRIAGRQISAFDPSHPSTITSRRTGGRGQVDVTLSSSLQTSLGFELQRERAGSTFITADAREIPVQRTVGGVFGEIRWNHGSDLFITAGLRAERIVRDELPGDSMSFVPRPELEEDILTSVNPRIGLAWFVRSSNGSFTKLRASAGTGIRPPDAFEIAFTDNPSLKPERSRSLEAGVDQAFLGGRATIEATAFYNKYDDLIVAVGSFSRSSRYRTDNISNASARGLELAGAARARIDWRVPVDVQARVAVTFLDTEILAVDRETAAPPPFHPGDPLLRRPARQASAELTVGAGRFSGFATAGSRSRTRDVDPSLGTFGGLFDAPGYAVFNAGAAWRLTSTVDLFGRVTNLFDRRYEEALGFPALGRVAVGGVRIATGR